MSEESRILRVLVIDPAPAFHHRVAHLLPRQPGLRLDTAAGLVAHADQLPAHPKADLFLLGVNFTPGQRLAQIRQLKARSPATPTLVVCEAWSPPEVEKLFRAGAGGCLLLADAPAEWIAAICTVQRGELFISPAFTSDLVLHVLQTQAPSSRAGVDRLTDRELAVLELLGDGLKTHQIAEHLHLSARTVESHREKIKHRLGLPNAAALSDFACAWIAHAPPSADGHAPAHPAKASAPLARSPLGDRLGPLSGRQPDRRAADFAV